jgi:hypothetical protein
MFPTIAHGARNVLIGWILLFQGLVFGDMCGVFSCNPAESGGWTLSWERYEENGVEKSGYFLRKPSSGIYRIFNLRETRGHAHVFLYLYPELERFVVFNPIAEHHKENRLLIYSFKGQLLHSLGIPDLLLEEEMDYPVSNMHILPFREDGNSAPLVKQLTDPLRMVVVTHAGRHVAITVADGKAQEVEAGLFVRPSANFDAERVRKALQELLLALPPLPKDARPALYTIRHGVEVTADELPMFHSEGVWISPPVNGTARAVGYVVDQESVRLQDSANPNPNPDAPLRMELRPLEMAAVLEHAQRLSSLSDTRRFDTHRREIPRDHGEALLFAARLFETGHPEAAIQLAAFYLNTFGEEEMERETGDALRDHLYRDILRAFHLDHDTLRFVTAVRTLLTDEGLPLLANIPPERTARKDTRSPSGSSEPDPFQSDPFEPNPFAAEPGTPSPFDPPVPERFVPRNSWWCGKEMDQVVKKWSQVLTLPDGDVPTPPNLLIEETERRLYRKWYALRRPLAEASLLLSEKNWLLLPENLARQAIEDSMNLYFKPEDLPKQLEQEPFIRRILRENEELAAIFPAMLHDTRPVPGRTVSIRRLQPAMGGSYLKELEVPVLMSDIATEMLMGIKVPNGMISDTPPK